MKLSQKQIYDIAQTLDTGLLCYIHKKTGEVRDMITDEMAEMGGVEEEHRADMEVIEKEPDKWVLIEPMMSRDAFSIMEDFADQVGNRGLQKRLIGTLNGRRPFANFKNAVDNSDEREDWFEFKQKGYEAWVRRELRHNFEMYDENMDSDE